MTADDIAELIDHRNTVIADRPNAAIDTLCPGPTLAVIMAHPDDETIGCGMALHAAARSGRTIALVMLTDGEGSHPGSTRYKSHDLAALRRRELDAALTALGCRLTSITRLGLEDGASRFDDISPATRRGIANRLGQLETSSIWTNWQRDPHCDHETAGRFALQIAGDIGADCWSCPIWGQIGDDVMTDGQVVTFEDEAAKCAKRRAIAAYKSQMTAMIDDDPDGFVMPAQLVDHFSNSAEIFVRA